MAGWTDVAAAETSTRRADRPETPESVVVYVGLGANLGDREATLRGAVRRLSELGAIEAVSSRYETKPVGYRDQPLFLNAVVRLRTDLTPDALLQGLLQIEREFGRVRTFANAPRTLDLDLLFYGGLIIEAPTLVVPHPRLHERAFVLAPLAEIAADLMHPRFGRRTADLLAALGETTGVRRVGALTEGQ